MSTRTTTWGRHRGSARADRKGRRVLSRRVSAFGAITLVVTGSTVALAEVTTPNPTRLQAVGPISGEHGYPTWYEDGNKLRLEQCLDILDQYCDPVFLRGEMPNGDAPVSFPDNWPTESFYYLAGAEFATSTGKAVLTAGLEATMANEEVRDGDQVVFGRLRFDIDFPEPGRYEVIHPYGVDTFDIPAADDFRYVEDITPAPDNFALALNSRIAPFLVDADGMHELPNGNKYVGNPAEETRVTGSPTNTNYFAINLLNEDGTKTNIGQTDLFSLMGKVSTNSGVTPNAAILVENANGKYLDVFASTDPNESISVEGTGLTKTLLDAEAGRYFGRIPLSAAVPTEVTLVNDTDRPVSKKDIKVTDGVTISSATYDTASDELTITASSTDQVDPPTLTLDGFTDATGAPVTMVGGGTVTVSTTAAPASVTVKSTGGGSGSAPVTVSGGTASQPAPTVAVIGGGQAEVLVGDSVTLTNQSLNAETVTWSEPDGQNLGVNGQTGNSVTFTAPQETGQYSIMLTANGPGGPQTTTYEFSVVTEQAPPPPPAAPVAAATTDVTDAYVGQKVTLSSSGSTGADSYRWEQIGGTDLNLDGAALGGSTLSFDMPVSSEPVAFRLTATGAGGEDTAEVSVNQVVDRLTATGEFRSDKSEWRWSGTATVTTVNTVRVYVQKTDGTKGNLVGSASVDATGAWTFKVRGGVAESSTRRVIVESTRGGSITNLTYTRR